MDINVKAAMGDRGRNDLLTAPAFSPVSAVDKESRENIVEHSVGSALKLLSVNKYFVVRLPRSDTPAKQENGEFHVSIEKLRKCQGILRKPHNF